MRKIYLPNDPLANLGKALFYVAYAWTVKVYSNAGADWYGRRMYEIHRDFQTYISLWPFAFVIEEDDVDLQMPPLREGGL